jgi:hypothetical protein
MQGLSDLAERVSVSQERTLLLNGFIEAWHIFPGAVIINNSMALVRQRTIPTERPPLVGEVSGNFCG